MVISHHFNRTAIFDAFCVLSLTYRTYGFITMFAPLRDYLRPQNPMSSPLLCATKDRYFARMSIDLNCNHPEFRESGWIAFEDLNVEHLLDSRPSMRKQTEYGKHAPTLSYIFGGTNHGTLFWSNELKTFPMVTALNLHAC